MTNVEKMAKAIKQARQIAGLSQKQLAKKLDLSDKTVSAYEKGRAIPPISALMKIAEITETSVSDILDLTEKNGEQEIVDRLQIIEEKIEKQTRSLKNRVKIDSFVGTVLVDKDSRIFLIREEDKHKISMGRWNLPGGSVDGDESLVDAAKRETKEETGYDAKITSLLGVYKCKKSANDWIYTVFKAEMTDNGQIIEDIGVAEGKWFTKKEFLALPKSKIVHPDMKLVYKIAVENRGLSIKSVKYIDYDKE